MTALPLSSVHWFGNSVRFQTMNVSFTDAVKTPVDER
jgi:hypothetical protein